MMSGPQPGFLVSCLRTVTPVALSSSVARAPWGSREEVPEELETIKRRRPG